MEAVLQTAVLSNATTAELHYLLACTSLSFATLTLNTHLWWTDGVTLPDSLRAKQKCYFYHYRPINQFHSPELFASKRLDD